MSIFKKWITSITTIICFGLSLNAQQVSPYQTGAYTAAFTNVRDMAQPPPGLFALWYNYYGTTDTYFDRNGDENSTLPLDLLDPSLPAIDLDSNIGSFITVPAIYWASPETMLGGARFMVGVTPSYMSVSTDITGRLTTAQGDTSISSNSQFSGFGDLSFSPAGLYWGFKKFDISVIYGITAPTGRYETEADDNIGLGFWTHQPQVFGFYYPVEDKSTALMLGLTYELNGDVKGEDFNPGNRFSLEWGLSQFFTDELELAVQGGHNWQATDDRGSEVDWNASVHDRKSTLGFMASYWLTDQFNINAKYNMDFGLRQRFKVNAFMLNIVFVTNTLTGNK